jgi:hypothetical protein
MTPLFVFLFSVPCLTALFMITFQLIEEHLDNANASQPPFEGFGRPTAKIQIGSFREVVATRSALSHLQSWSAAGNAASTPASVATPVQPPQAAKLRTKRLTPVLAKRSARPTFRKPAMPLVLPNEHIAGKPPTQPAGRY